MRDLWGEAMSIATLERVEQLVAPASAQDARELRHRVAKTLADWGVAERCDDVLGSCAEMLANALDHGCTAVLTVDLAEHDGWLHMAVPDRSPDPPYLVRAGRDDEDGRGVWLLAALCDAWGFRAAQDGKSVFAEFRIG
jgi:hypothetical protein